MQPFTFEGLVKRKLAMISMSWTVPSHLQPTGWQNIIQSRCSCLSPIWRVAEI